MNELFILSMDGGALLSYSLFQSNDMNCVLADAVDGENEPIRRLQQSAKLYTIYHLMKQDLSPNSSDGMNGVGEKEDGKCGESGRNMDYWIQMNDTQTCFWECVSPHTLRPCILIILVTDMSISREIAARFLQELSSVYASQGAVGKDGKEEEDTDGKNTAKDGSKGDSDQSPLFAPLHSFYEYIAQVTKDCEYAKKRERNNKWKSKQFQDRESQMVMSAILSNT